MVTFAQSHPETYIVNERKHRDSLTLVAPKSRQSTSSVMTRSRVPRALSIASSASASPGACQVHPNHRSIRRPFIRSALWTHKAPFKAKRFYDLCKVTLEAVCIACDELAALVLWSMRAIENKERETAASREPCYAEEEGSQVGIGCRNDMRSLSSYMYRVVGSPPDSVFSEW